MPSLWYNTAMENKDPNSSPGQADPLPEISESARELQQKVIAGLPSDIPETNLGSDLLTLAAEVNSQVEEIYVSEDSVSVDVDSFDGHGFSTTTYTDMSVYGLDDVKESMVAFQRMLLGSRLFNVIAAMELDAFQKLEILAESVLASQAAKAKEVEVESAQAS